MARARAKLPLTARSPAMRASPSWAASARRGAPATSVRAQGRLDGPACRIEVFAPWDKALSGLDAYEMVEVLYWLDLSRRDLLVQNPKSDGVLYGAFALRSPVRPNPIGTALVRLLSIDGSVLTVQGLDCVDGTPLVDLKPDRCAFTPKAPPKAADT